MSETRTDTIWRPDAAEIQDAEALEGTGLMRWGDRELGVEDSEIGEDGYLVDRRKSTGRRRTDTPPPTEAIEQDKLAPAEPVYRRPTDTEPETFPAWVRRVTRAWGTSLRGRGRALMYDTGLAAQVAIPLLGAIVLGFVLGAAFMWWSHDRMIASLMQGVSLECQGTVGNVRGAQ